MTGLLVFLLSFAGWFLSLAGITSWPPATIPLFITSSAITILYIFSLAGSLTSGAYFLAAAGIVLGIIGALHSRARSKEYFSKLLEPGPALFFLLAVTLWPLLSGAHYAYWDEFSHWGLAAKEIFLLNALPPLESALRFKDYPPGTALFQYFVTFFTGWSEGATAFAQVLLLLSAAVALLQNITWKQGTKLTAVLSTAYLLTIMFNYRPQSLYVDHVLGFLFGISVASALISEDGTRGTLLRIIPTLLILPLIKAAGLVLALIAAAAVISNHIIASWMRPEKNRPLAAFLLCAALALAPLIAAKSWGAHITSLGITKTFSTHVSLSDIGKSFSASTAAQGTTILNFMEALYSKQVGRTIPPLFLIVILTLAALIALRNEKRFRENLQIRAVYLWLLSGFAVYASGLLLLYLFSFSSYEGPRLASFGRYMGVFFLAWSFVTTAFFLRPPPANPGPRAARHAVWLIILAALISLISGSLKKVNPEKALLHKNIREKAAYAVSKTPADARIYVIWQNSDGFEPQVMAYELAPRIASTKGGGWSLGKPYGPQDVWTVDISPRDWQTTLKDYDFVLIGKADKPFRDRFSPLFETHPTSDANYLFKVTPGKDKIKLQIVR